MNRTGFPSVPNTFPAMPIQLQRRAGWKSVLATYVISAEAGMGVAVPVVLGAVDVSEGSGVTDKVTNCGIKVQVGAIVRVGGGGSV